MLLKPDERRIDVNMSMARSAISTIAGTFVPVGEDACDVKFYIEYEFKSRTLGLLMGSMFDYAFRRFAEAFEARADVIYGDGARGAQGVGLIGQGVEQHLQRDTDAGARIPARSSGPKRTPDGGCSTARRRRNGRGRRASRPSRRRGRRCR